MLDFFKFLVRNLGFSTGKSISRDKVEDFIEKLWPKKTNHQLIRLGPNKDGGYLVPDDLDNIEACFSPGVDDMSDFELACFNRGMKIFLADRSVDKPNINLSENNYHFIQKFIGPVSNDEHISIDDWIDSSVLQSDSDLLLQMDIEGSEYSSILSISNKTINRFRIMVIEFHDLHKLWNKEFFRLAQDVFSKILATHHCVHIHPNNECDSQITKGIEIPLAAEFTFLRKDRVKTMSYATHFPHKFDCDNVNKKSLILPKNWYAHDPKGANN